MNYYEQFAKIFGLELEQEFSLTKPNGKELDMASYKITEDGIYYKPTTKSIDWFEEPANTLDFLLSGEFGVLPKPWKPKEGELYWYYSKTLNQAISRNWDAENYALCLWKCGNCFKTEKEANEKGKEIMKQIQKEYEEA